MIVYHTFQINNFGENFKTIMLLPNAENAVVDLRKLNTYCLNTKHKTGKHKARLFRSMLGMGVEDASKLREILLAVVKSHEAKLALCDVFGQRYTIDFVLEWKNKSAVVRSGWIIEVNSQIPRLTSCYPLK